MVEYIEKLKIPLRIQSNVREISVNQKTKIPGYNNRVWFSRRAIINTIALKNLTEQYRGTYASNERMFIVHTKDLQPVSMEFLMHDSGIHYYEPPKKDVVFLNTASKDREVFSKR